MSNSIKYSFIAGLCFLALGWSFFVHKTTSELKAAKSDSFELKTDLIELRWSQIMNRQVKFGLGKGPEVFNIELSGLDKTILGSEFSAKYKAIPPGIVKAAYLDAGLNASFFTTQIKGETFFVKVDNTKENTMLQGFTYAYVLNLLNAGIAENEWYFLDGKNQVVFSHEASYLGQSKSFKAASSKTVRAGGSKYSIQIVDPSPFQSAGVFWLGLIGFILIGAANFPQGSSEEDSSVELSEAVTTQDVIIRKESNISQSVEVNAPVVVNEREHSETVSIDIEENDTEVSMADEFEAVSLETGSTAENKDDPGQIGYSEFLTENPSLSLEIPAIPNKKILDEVNAAPTQAVQDSVPPTPGVIEEDNVLMSEEAATSNKAERSGNDWIKLAEELSANLEKFADEWKEDPNVQENEA